LDSPTSTTEAGERSLVRSEYTAALDELGVETLDDLIDVTVGDLTAEAVGMKPIQARRFVRLATE
jgi:hypothetical protein